MGRIIGLDLGTNSIGWAIREGERFEREQFSKQFKDCLLDLDNEIVDEGVVIFQKGVGEGKAGEFSLAAERRKSRSKRRLYNAKRYRKWALLKILIDAGMCPLTMDELRLWSVGNWRRFDGKKKNLGRVYPIGNEEFQKWLAFDPSYFGKKDVSENGRPIRKNPYDLRFELICGEEENEFTKKQKIGRALYHLVQRRGFKSSRKIGKSTYAENEELEKRKQENPDFQITMLAKEKLDNKERFRASGVIQRRYFEDEFYSICDKQKVNRELTQKLYKAIYFVRPLRSQKGLVGNCTLEKGKARIPISHPKFEEFRALTFINNLKRREAGTQTYEAIPISMKKQILEELFFRKLTSGKNKGKVNLNTYFKFDEIIEKYSEGGKYEFNYKNKPNISTCPTIAALMNVFDEEWQDKFIVDEKSYGINWDGLSVNYTVKYGKKTGEMRSLKVDEIWHLLFDYIQTKDKVEELETFTKNVFGFDDDKAEKFSAIDIPQGYGSLSKSAISKILPLLQCGFIYSEAVSFANLKKVLGNKFETNKELVKKIISDTIRETGKTKEKLNIVNGLIQYFFAGSNGNRAKGVDSHIKEMAAQDTADKLKKYFGDSDWNKKSENQQRKWEDEILKLYLKFLEGKQVKEEKASSRLNKNPEIDYYKLPRVDEVIKQRLKATFDLSDERLKYLYHPSDIEIYPKSKREVKVRIDGLEQWVPQLESPQPPSKGWKNPMAMRTLHELRRLLNYLLRAGKIDHDTKVVVEMARELNDANKRWAIQTYQRYREDENKEFAKAIVGVAKEKYPNLDENNVENINKVRLWWEQVENSEEVYKQIKALKEDVQKYRLWKEQECLCMYTGEVINLADLFDGTQTHFEHTLPVSDSFDNSLANLTVCKAYFNTHIKKDKIPTQLDNYSQDINGYSAIEPRLKKWQNKILHLKNLIDDNKVRTKKAQDPEIKKGLIQRRHLLQFDYDYWKKKVDAFTVRKIPNSWKNSQLVDTQIISKYARAYLKTVFNKVDVQKGAIVNNFKKIYQIKGNEQKDRSKHSHHAVDAATLTLIPGSARREAILKEYYTALGNNSKFHTKPYKNFATSHILDIESHVIINHVIKDKTLTATFKNIRKRGKTTGWIAQGDSIRGKLHKETFFGAIKALDRNECGFPIKENGKYKIRKNPKTGEDEIWIVSRKAITDVKIDKGLIKDVIVDQLLKQHIQKQLDDGVEPSAIVDFNGKPIRHIRMRVKAGIGYLSKQKAIAIKDHAYPSKHFHKREVLTQNEENYLFLLYEGINEKGKTIRSYRILNLFDIAQLGIKHINEIKDEPEFQTIVKGKLLLQLKVILKSGNRMIFFKKNKDEITDSNALLRLYKLFKFNEMGSPFLYFQHHLEARSDAEIEKPESTFDDSKYQARLMLVLDKINCLFEGIDFEVKPDGKILFK